MAKRGQTKKRIVDAARDAFNTLRYGNVTTALLAERLGMSEGNLWYHYKTKRDLLDAIQSDFAEDVRETVSALSHWDDPVEAYADFLMAWRDLFAKYFFVFRDRGEYGGHSPDLIELFPMLYQAVEASVTAIFDELIKTGKLSVKAEEVPDLAFNAILVTRYYFEFQEERLSNAAEQSNLTDAMLRHMTLFHGRLDPEVAASVTSALLASD